MANENKDIIRVFDTAANLPTTMRAGMIGYDTTNDRIAVKRLADGAMRYFSNTQITELDLAGDSGTGTVNLTTETLTVTGVANEIETSVSGDTITIGIPDDLQLSGTFLSSMTDDTDGAFEIKEGSNSYIKIDTTDLSELISFDNADVEFNSPVSIKDNLYMATGSSFTCQSGIDWQFKITDNNSTAFYIIEGSTNSYITCDTLDSDEKVIIGTNSFHPKFHVKGGETEIDISDDTEDAFLVQEGSNDYIAIDTDNTSPKIDLGNAVTNPDYNFLGSGNVDLGGDLIVSGSLSCQGGLLDLGTGGSSGSPSSDSIAGKTIIKVTPTTPGTDNYYNLTNKTDGQIIYIRNTSGTCAAYIDNGATTNIYLFPLEAKIAIWDQTTDSWYDT